LANNNTEIHFRVVWSVEEGHDIQFKVRGYFELDTKNIFSKQEDKKVFVQHYYPQVYGLKTSQADYCDNNVLISWTAAIQQKQKPKSKQELVTLTDTKQKMRLSFPNRKENKL